MEDTSKIKYINISDRPFVPTKYINKDYVSFGMKSHQAFWGALPSNDEDFYSKWDEEFLVCDSLFDDEKDAYITTFEYGENTTIVNPEIIGYSTIHSFYETVKDISKSDEEIRKLFVEVLKNKKLVPENTEHIICQVDLIEDLTTLQKAFTGYDLDSNNSQEVYKNFDYKVMKGITQCFSGLELTAYALGVEPYDYSSAIYEYETVALSRDPNYMEDNFCSHIGGWDVQSVSIFDTDAIKVIDTKKISKPTVK